MQFLHMSMSEHMAICIIYQLESYHLLHHRLISIPQTQWAFAPATSWSPNCPSCLYLLFSKIPTLYSKAQFKDHLLLKPLICPPYSRHNL